MILNALTNYYEILLKEGKVGKDGWSTAKVSYAITIDNDGEVKGIVSLMTPEERGKKTVLVPVQRTVPLQKGRSSQIAPYFLCDNAKYLLGAWVPSGDAGEDAKRKKQAAEYFAASASYHRNLLEDSDSELSQSICRFFDTWDYEKNKSDFQVDWAAISTANLVFRSYETIKELQEDEEIQHLWEEYSDTSEEEKKSRCLVTGKVAPVARLHPLLKGVRGAQSSGAALVSFNGAAFESYGKEQGENAPVSEYVVNAYGKALNYLLSDSSHFRILGDTTTVFWAESEQNEDAYAQFMMELLGDMEESEEEKLLKIMDAIARGNSCNYEEMQLDPDTKFYVLGLSPNAARISIRFFYSGSFGKMISNIQEHYRRLAIESPEFEKKKYPSVGDILYETVNKNSSSKHPQPILVGALMRSILDNTRYPDAVYNHIMLRIHSERYINRNRAAILKAYILNNFEAKREVVDTMVLNEETEYTPYVLGRLFAVLEDIQTSAIGKETIKDRYFNAASSTPAVVFPQLLKLSNSHMRVLAREKKGLQIVKDRELQELFDKIHNNFPAHLSLEDQGVFMIGYYHQVQKRYKSNKEQGKQED
jgi:CRISPR-associated protein Csd1